MKLLFKPVGGGQSFTADDVGKVVKEVTTDNYELVNQQPYVGYVSDEGTYDTTFNNSITFSTPLIGVYKSTGTLADPFSNLTYRGQPTTFNALASALGVGIAFGVLIVKDALGVGQDASLYINATPNYQQIFAYAGNVDSQDNSIVSLNCVWDDSGLIVADVGIANSAPYFSISSLIESADQMETELTIIQNTAAIPD